MSCNFTLAGILGVTEHGVPRPEGPDMEMATTDSHVNVVTQWQIKLERRK
jgi:hypothetical protein